MSEARQVNKSGEQVRATGNKEFKKGVITMKTIKFKFPSIRKAKLPTFHFAKPNSLIYLLKTKILKTKIFDSLRRPLVGERRAVGLDIGTRYIKIVQLKKKLGDYKEKKV